MQVKEKRSLEDDVTNFSAALETVVVPRTPPSLLFSDATNVPDERERNEAEHSILYKCASV